MPAPRISNVTEELGQRRRYTDASIRPTTTNGNYKATEVLSPPSSAPTHSLPVVPELISPLTTHFSPSLAFSPLPHAPFDPMFGMPTGTSTPLPQSAFEQVNPPAAAMTPRERSLSASEQAAEAEQDPFLSLLEQLAENEYSQDGPSDLEFYLGKGEG